MSNLSKISFLLAGLSFVSFVVVRFLLGTWVPFLWVAIGLFLFFLLFGVWLERAIIAEFSSLRTTKKGMSMGALIGLVLILLIAINFLGARRYKTFDFSLSKKNTLSEQSAQMLKNLDTDLKVTYFYKKGTEGVEQLRRAFIDIMKLYQDSSSYVKLEFVEVNERPDLAEKYEVKKGTQVVYMEYKGRKVNIESVNEQELTSAIVKVTREKGKTVYFLSGHDEFSENPSQDGQSVGKLKQLLEGNRYTVKELSFLQKAEVPEDADVVLALRPNNPLLQPEIKALEDYLKRGGSVLLALEPKSQHGLEDWLKKFGLELGNNFVASVLKTPIGNAIDPRFTRGSVFSKTHQITKPFGEREFVMFRLPMVIKKLESAPKDFVIEEIVKTDLSAMAFADAQFKSEPKEGPFPLAVSVQGKLEGGTKDFHLAVFGDADIMNDQYLIQTINRDLVLNTTAFLAKEENLISITPKEVTRTELNITPTQWTMYVFGFIIPLPVLLFLTSGVLWYRRRYS